MQNSMEYKVDQKIKNKSTGQIRTVILLSGDMIFWKIKKTGKIGKCTSQTMDRWHSGKH